MKSRRHLSVFVAFILSLSIFAQVAYAHPGRTDSNGGHTNSSTGEYHYHHGYDAHSHYDVDGDGVADCPYDFDDQTGMQSGQSSNSGITSSETEQAAESTIATQNNDSSQEPTNSSSAEIFADLDPSAEYFLFGLLVPVICIPILIFCSFLENHNHNKVALVLFGICALLWIITFPASTWGFMIFFAITKKRRKKSK